MVRILVALFALGLTLSVNQAADEPLKHPRNTCVKPCNDCAASCAEMAKHCRAEKMESLAVEVETCQHLCLTCALAVEHKKPLAWQICELCEKYCTQCAIECDKAGGEHAKKCADICRTCAKACAEARK